MTIKSAYCPYCNYDKVSNRTKEHFIPKCIDGRWVIGVCAECNRTCGANSDSVLSNILFHHRIFKYDWALRKDVIVTLKSGHAMIGMASYGKHPNWVKRWDGREIPLNNVKTVEFPIGFTQDLLVSLAPSIAKICVGAIWFLLTSSRQPSSVIGLS